MKKEKKFDAMKAAKAAIRKAHFAAGGTTTMWRGRGVTFTDRKKRANRRACRGNFSTPQGG